MVESNVTGSPGAQPVTPPPSPAITPAASCPIMIGGRRRPVLPSRPCTSLPQIPHALTATSTSSAAGDGAGTSSSTSLLYSLRTKAFMVLGMLYQGSAAESLIVSLRANAGPLKIIFEWQLQAFVRSKSAGAPG